MLVQHVKGQPAASTYFRERGVTCDTNRETPCTSMRIWLISQIEANKMQCQTWYSLWNSPGGMKERMITQPNFAWSFESGMDRLNDQILTGHINVTGHITCYFWVQQDWSWQVMVRVFCKFDQSPKYDLGHDCRKPGFWPFLPTALILIFLVAPEFKIWSSWFSTWCLIL